MSKISFVPVSFTISTSVNGAWRPGNMLLAPNTGPRSSHDIAAAASTSTARYTAPVGDYSHILVTAADSVILAWGSDPVAAVDAAPNGGAVLGVVDLMFGGQMPLLVKPGQLISWMKRD